MKKPFRYWHNKENCIVVASLCKSKSEFHTKYRAAYRASKQEGWFDELCKLYWNFSDWTIEQCKEEASKYTDRSEFYTHSRLAYKAAEANGWLEGICNHMMDSECYWTYELCAEEALKYSSKIEFAHNNEAAYRSALHNGWLDDICSRMEVKRRKSFSKTDCLYAAKLYERIVDFEKAEPSMYNAARRNGWLSDITKHMHHRNNWTFDLLAKEALQYQHKIDFLRGNASAYTVASRMGILNEICKHMKDLGDLYNRAIYAWEFPDKRVYVGLTDNIDRRFGQHMNDDNSPVKKYMRKTGLEPVFVLKYDYVHADIAKELEGQVLEEYVCEGWIKLNKIKTGGLGSVREKWTKERIRELALTCRTRQEFREKYSDAYSKCSKKRLMYILDELFPKEVRIDKSGRVYRYTQRKWTDEMILEEAKKYSSLSELRIKARKVYRAAEKWGLMERIASEYKTISNISKRN